MTFVMRCMRAMMFEGVDAAIASLNRVEYGDEEKRRAAEDVRQALLYDAVRPLTPLPMRGKEIHNA